MAAGHQLDGIGDPVAANQRGLHALGAHRNAVGDRDRVELDRGTAVGADALGDLLRELAMIRVARRQLDPAVRDADERPREVFVGEADGAAVRARGRAVGAVQQRATLVAGGGNDEGAPPRGGWGPPPAPPRRGKRSLPSVGPPPAAWGVWSSL